MIATAHHIHTTDNPKKKLVILDYKSVVKFECSVYYKYFLLTGSLPL